MKRRLRTIVIAFSVSFLLMAGLSLFSIERFDTLVKYSNEVAHSNLVMRSLYQVEGRLKDMDRAERGYMITHDTMYTRLLFANIDSAKQAAENAKQLIGDNILQSQKLVMLRSLLIQRISLAHQNIAYIDTTHSAGVSPYYNEDRTVMLDCSKTMRDMHAEENRILKEASDKEHFYQQLTSISLKYLLIVFFALTMLLFLLLIKELRKRLIYQNELQVKLLDLKRSHSELEQIAYAASHDLQEPLRKIQVFSNRFLWIKNKEIDAESRDTILRITASANRMQNLIEDLVNLTSLTKNESAKEKVNLGEPVEKAIDDLEEKISLKNAIVNLGPLPDITGYPNQLNLIFKALMDNSLKFTREGTQPVINITSEIVSGEELTDINKKLQYKKFIRITFADNGIGFDNKFSHKMFQIFQRLHNQHSDYDGKGIGLAICQRIMANHEGYILGYGHVEVGATFKLFFPISEG